MLRVPLEMSHTLPSYLLHNKNFCVVRNNMPVHFYTDPILSKYLPLPLHQSALRMYMLFCLCWYGFQMLHLLAFPLSACYKSLLKALHYSYFLHNQVILLQHIFLRLSIPHLCYPHTINYFFELFHFFIFYQFCLYFIYYPSVFF